MKRVRTLVLAVTMVVGCGLLAACGSSDEPTTLDSKYNLEPPKELKQAAGGETAKLVVGGKNFFAEQDILGYITLAALDAAGAQGIDKIDLGSTQQVRSALLDGTIDMYWGYTGTGALIHLAQADPPRDPHQLYKLVAKLDLKKNNIVWLPPAPANNTYAIATRAEVFKQGTADYDKDLAQVKTISDLARLVKQHPDKATICVGPEFERRADGLPGLESRYGFKFPEANVFVYPAEAVYNALDVGQKCNYGSVFNDNGNISHLKLRILPDNEHFFPAYNPSLTMRKETLDRYPDLKPMFTDIARRLDSKTMRHLTEKVLVDHQPAKQVAKQWLEEQGLMS
ncbi:MAG: glycine betaine ABC transporter substrate-binding protein [Nocardioidaceae bacterium]